MLSCPHTVISENNQTYRTSPSCYYVLELLCVTYFKISQHFLAPTTKNIFAAETRNKSLVKNSFVFKKIDPQVWSWWPKN